jgi:hypothetical protein
MTPTPVSTSAQLVPSGSMRAGMLAYIGALAAIEVSTGVIVAEAWREQRHRVVVRSDDMRLLGEMFTRLRVIEGVVAAGAVITTVLWSFIAVRNASTACRNGRSGSTAVVAWGVVPLVVLALCSLRGGSGMGPTVVLAVQAAAIFLPFATIGVAARRVGGRMAPFVRWYVALTLTFLVHEAFTGSFNLADPKPSHDLGRAAALMIGSALALGLMVLMAADAAKSMEAATEQKMQTHRDWRGEALERFRAVVGAGGRSLPPQPDRHAFAPMSMVASIPMMAPRSGVLVAEAPAPAAMAVAEVEMVPQPVMPVPVMPAPRAAEPVVDAAPVAEAPSMFAPLHVRTVSAEQAVPRPEPVVAPVAAAEVAPEPEPEPAPAPPPTSSMFAPLAPRSTPRSL